MRESKTGSLLDFLNLHKKLGTSCLILSNKNNVKLEKSLSRQIVINKIQMWSHPRGIGRTKRHSRRAALFELPKLWPVHGTLPDPPPLLNSRAPVKLSGLASFSSALRTSPHSAKVTTPGSCASCQRIARPHKVPVPHIIVYCGIRTLFLQFLYMQPG